MKKPLLVLACLFYSSMLFAQINLDIKNKKISFFSELEAKNKSELIKNGSVYVNDGDIGQPVIYKRKETGLPDLMVYYFPLKSDSTIDNILYEWQDDQPRIMSWNETKPFIEKYKELVVNICSHYGKNHSTGDLADTSLIAKGGLTRTDEWKNDTTDIEMYITLSNEHLVKGSLSTRPTHRIRLSVRKPAQTKKSMPLSNERVSSLEITAKAFINDVVVGKFDDSRQYISSFVSAQIKNEQLDSFRKMIRDSNWELNMSGVQITTTGKSYVYLSYSRKDDKSKPPLEILNITFDDDGKIISARPLNRVASQFDK
ncbi:MAG: hypothetical protein ACXVIY_08660 [Mucilaginibacter sp.]